MSSKRKKISKKTRFEVFKRDLFTCKYCGKKAPDCVLEVDHIKPVAKGGSNDMLNLITACADCNRGKGKTLLDDSQELDKQHEELKLLQKQREQLEMLLEWRDELNSLDNQKADIVIKEFEEVHCTTLTDSGKKSVKGWIKRFEVEDLIKAIDKSINYKDPNKAFEKIPAIVRNLKNNNECSYRLGYAKGILRNRIGYINEKMLHAKFYPFSKDMDSIEKFIEVCKKIDSWSELKEFLEVSLDYYDCHKKGAFDKLSDAIDYAWKEIKGSESIEGEKL
jgi:hypothetical protein